MSTKIKTIATKEDGKATLTPKLRFPEFRDAEGWEPVTLQEASGPVAERVGQRKLTPVSISAGIGFVPQSEKFGRDISGNQYQLYTLVRDGDFVFNKGNSLKFPQGCVYLLKGWGEVAAPNVFICFRLKNGYSDGFFQNCFEQNQHGKQLKKHITSGARSNGLLNISKETFFSIEIPTPSLPEQQKIAECLSSVDELIAAEARKLDALKTHKKGLMQQLFPREGETQPRLRFPEFQNAGEWEVKKLGQIAKYTKGFAFKSQDYKNAGVRIIRVSDLGADFIKPNNEKLYISSESEHEYARYKLTASEIIVTTVGSKPELVDSAVGRGIYVNSNNEGLLNQNLLKLEVLSGVNSRFLFSHINTPEYQRFIASISRGNANQANIAVKDLMGFMIKAPRHAEQQRIADCLTTLDDLIAAQTQKLAALKTHKKGLMQQLFPSPEETL